MITRKNSIVQHSVSEFLLLTAKGYKQLVLLVAFYRDGDFTKLGTH